MAAGKPIIGVLEEGTEVRRLIEECHCGKCCEPGDYVEVADIIRWYIENAESDEVQQMGMNGRKYLEKFEDNCVIAGNPAKVIKRLEIS